jgi:MFS family permease
VGRFRTFDSLAIRDYRLLWLGQVSTSMGQWMDQVTRGWLMYELTGSALQLGAAAAVRGLPLMFFSIAAGALADRSGRKAQLIIAQVVNAILNIILATLVLTGQVEPWHIYVTGFLAGTVQAFQQPARQTLIGDIVGDHRLMNALALNSAALNGSRTLGPAIAGGLITGLGIAGSYYVQGVMYLIATVWTMQMRVPSRPTGSEGRPHEPFLPAIGAGFSYVAKDPDIRAMMLLGLGPLTFGMAYASLMPLLAKELGGEAGLQGTLLSMVGVGSLAGALTVASVRGAYGYGLPVVLGAAAFSIFVFLLASSPWIWLSVLLAACVGASNVAYNTQNQTLLQVMTPRHLRGRVMSIRMLERGIVPLCSLLAGLLAEWWGGPSALRVMSVAGLVLVLLAVATTPRVLRLKVSYQDFEGSRGGHGGGSTAAVPEPESGATGAVSPAATERA